MARTTASLIALATAVPEHVLDQRDVAAAVARVLGDAPGANRMAGVFRAAGVARRRAVMPLDWYCAQRDWPERMAAYLDGAMALFVEVVRKVLAKAALAGPDVDAVVFVSSTGFATPSLEARAAATLGFRPDVERVPVFGLGCAGGVTGLGIASRLALARPGANVLMVAIEACTLAARIDRMDKADIVSTALFGDGAAACLLCAGEARQAIAEIEAAGEHLWPDTLGVMGWSVDRDGLGVILDPIVPAFAEAEAGKAFLGVLARFGLSGRDVGRFVCHPGSNKVTAALERSLDLADGSLDHERAVLAEFGNMSSPTALFVLERAVAAGLPERAALVAMGPGFTATLVSLVRPQ